MSRQYTIRPASIQATINDALVDLASTVGQGGIACIEDIEKDENGNPTGGLTCTVLKRDEANKDERFSEALGNFSKVKDLLLLLKDQKTYKDSVIVVFADALEPPSIVIEVAQVVAGAVVGKTLELSDSNAFLVYQPSGTIAWKPLGKVKKAENQGTTPPEKTE